MAATKANVRQLIALAVVLVGWYQLYFVDTVSGEVPLRDLNGWNTIAKIKNVPPGKGIV